MSTVELLRAALAKLEGGHGWTQRFVARDASGSRVRPQSPEARRWCPSGACAAAAHDAGGVNWIEADEALRLEVPNGWLNTWNDDPTRTWADVDTLFGRAIDNAEARAA